MRGDAPDPSVFLLGEDIGKYGGAFGVTRGMMEEFGEERVRDTPISEAAITGVRSGRRDDRHAAHRGNHVQRFHHHRHGPAGQPGGKGALPVRRAGSIPMVLRTPEGSGTGAAAQHSQSVEAWILNVPGSRWSPLPPRRTRRVS